MKKSLCFVLALMLVLAIGITASANSLEYGELLGFSSKIYSTEAEITTTNKLYDALSKEISNLIVSTNTVNIKNNGDSEFVDVIAQYADGTFENITDLVQWQSDNTEVVFADQGRILALDKGHADVIVSFLDFKKVIKVNVLGKINFEEKISQLESKKNNNEMELATTYLRDVVVKDAKAMVDVSWTPTQNLIGWRGNYTFSAGTTYKGIPYSQTAYQKDDTGFITSMGDSSFYDYYTRTLNNETIRMPKYGNDCSAFVSFAWGISRKTTTDFVNGIKDGTYKKIGSYNADNPTSTELTTAYKLLQKGDAVVKSGHTFLIASNDITNSKVYVYEQTPYKAIYTTWTYSKMATDKYMPFTLTYMDDNISPYSVEY